MQVRERYMLFSEKKLAGYLNDVPIDDAIGIAQETTVVKKLVRLRAEDIEKAFQNAKKVVVREKLPDIPINIQNEIAKLEQWDLLSEVAKSVVGMFWARTLGDNAMVIVHDTDTVPKNRIRGLIMQLQGVI